jgi:type IV pilus assembly protein PilV
MKRARIDSGFTLLEALVALTLLAVGLLGVVALVLSGLRTSHEAQLQTSAITLAADLGDRIRANRTASAGYALDEGAVLDRPSATCRAAGECTSADIARLDLYEWQQDAYANLPGCVTRVTVESIDGGGTTTFGITIGWLPRTDSARVSIVLVLQA